MDKVYMSDNDVIMLKGEMETVKAVMTEKWASHDKRSDERWMDLMDKIHVMERKIDTLSCRAHGELMTDISSKVISHEKRLDGIVAKLWAVVMVVIAALVTALFGLFKHN